MQNFIYTKVNVNYPLLPLLVSSICYLCYTLVKNWLIFYLLIFSSSLASSFPSIEILMTLRADVFSYI